LEPKPSLKPDLVLEPEPNLDSNLELKLEPKTKSGFFENIFWKKKKVRELTIG
jgi:hypothetical protein